MAKTYSADPVSFWAMLVAYGILCAPALGARLSHIRFAQIEPTTRCNFTCGFCAGRYMPQRDLTWDDFQTFLAAHPALRHVELQGEGEPLLHPLFFDMVAACRARGILI